MRKYKKVDVVTNKDFCKGCGLNLDSLSLTQKRNIDKLIYMIRGFAKDPELTDKVKQTVIDFAKRTEGLDSHAVSKVFNSIKNQVRLKNGSYSRKNYSFPLDLDLLDQLRTHYHLHMSKSKRK